MNLIVAVDNNWAIGCNNELLIRIPADQRFFREETTGKVVVLGRKTMETFPNGQPLKNRTNIVISKNTNLSINDAIVVNSIEEALNLLKQYKSEDIYIIGGASIYEQFLPYCDVAHVTKINYKYHADTYFPNLDLMSDWVMDYESEEQTYYDIEYTFQRYIKKIK